jgi:hypothetical protein
MSRFEAKDFRNLINQIEESLNSEGKQVLHEAAFDKQQAINLLAGFRSTAKQSERVNSPPLPDNFANQLANGLWEVISWLQAQPNAPAAPTAAPTPPVAPAAPAAPVSA